MSEVIDLLADIEGKSSLQEKFDLFSRYMTDEYHYSGVNYGIFLDTRSRAKITESFVAKRTGLSADWRAHYQREGFGKRDCAMLSGAVGSRPILQSQFYQMVADEQLQPEFVDVVNAVRDHVNCGVVIPIAANGLRAVIGLYNPQGDERRHNERFERNRKRIETMATLFHRSCEWELEVTEQRGLSELNLSVLKYKAQGLRVKEILHKIGRNNPKTVDNHMMRVRKALSAETDSEAIAKASKLGLLKNDQVFQVSSLYLP
jgi:DNA-binding CsgD family transcriptional regulator